VIAKNIKQIASQQKEEGNRKGSIKRQNYKKQNKQKVQPCQLVKEYVF
jgi:hypothetical protein